MQELSLRARVMLASTGPSGTFWAEAMYHGNWLRNRSPTKMIENNLPIHLWRANENVIDFSALPTFKGTGFSFIYTEQKASNEKLHATALHVCFIGIESDERLCGTYNPVNKGVYIVRRVYFKPCRKEKLQLIFTSVGRLSRQSKIDAQERQGGFTENSLHQALSSVLLSMSASNNKKDS